MEKDVVTQQELQLEEQIRESCEKFRLDMSNHNERVKSYINKYGSDLMGAAEPVALILKTIFFGF